MCSWRPPDLAAACATLGSVVTATVAAPPASTLRRSTPVVCSAPSRSSSVICCSLHGELESIASADLAENTREHPANIALCADGTDTHHHTLGRGSRRRKILA